MADECWFCRSDRGADAPPGGWLVDDGTWRAWHVHPGWGPAGTVIVESHRHFLDFGDIDAAEAATFPAVLGALFPAIKRVTGADRVYVWATMDRHPHMHVWLVPWREDLPSRGPRYLVGALVDDVPDCDVGEVEATVGRLRAELGPVAVAAGQP